MRRWMIASFVVGLAVVAMTPADAAAPSRPDLIESDSAAVTVGDTAWLAFTWRAEGDLENFRVTAKRTKGIEVAYPANTATFAAPYQSAHLMDGEIDFTAVRVHVADNGSAGRSRHMMLHLEASWDDGPRRRTSTHPVKIPLARYTGSDVAQVTDRVDVPPGDGAWVEIAYAGLAPRVGAFSVVVEGADGLPITYPGYGSSTSLHHDDELEDGETDVVRFYVDTAGVAAGDHVVRLTASYDRAGTSASLEGDVTVVVLP